MEKTFLTAEWRKLIIANYEVPAEVLEKYLPLHTEPDAWNDVYYVSLVGFMFVNTKVKGLPIPFHINFEEVNLRFYVKNKDHHKELRRGVVFIKEIVPKPAVTFIANNLYRENYKTLRMKNKWHQEKELLSVEYHWKYGRWHSMKAIAEFKPEDIKAGSEEEFITEHYWGYTKRNEHHTSEYKVVHPRWQVYKINSYNIDVDFGKLYGDDFKFLNNTVPKSVFLAEGSEVAVKKGYKTVL